MTLPHWMLNDFDSHFFNTPFALGASVLYVELVQIQSADNSSFRLYGLYDTPLDAARAQTEDGRKKFVQSPIFR